MWRKEIALKIYMGMFIAPNVTISEEIDPNTGQIVVNCSVWANPRPNINLFVDTEVDIRRWGVLGRITCLSLV